MTLTELRYIVAVAHSCHFGRAAEACFVSQPTLSVAIKKLEDELGVALFERGGEVTVTPVGTRIIEQAARILELTSELKTLAQHGKDPLAGTLRLGAIYTIAPYLLPQMIPKLHALAPHMPLLLEENFTSFLTEKLKRGELDAIIVSLPFDEPGIETRVLYTEPFQIALPAGHAWCAKSAIAADELIQESLLLLNAGHCFRDQVLKVCPALNRSAAAPGSMQKTLESSSLETIRHMVASGAGITVMPCTAVPLEKADQGLLVFRPFSEPAPDRHVAIAWRKSFTRPDALDVVRKAVQSCNFPCVRMAPSQITAGHVKESFE